MARPKTLLSEIEAAAHDPASDLAGLLRKCISLGGATGSDRLREWAALELKGYGDDDELPKYRIAHAPLVLDGVSGFNHIRGQAVPANMIPEFARDRVGQRVPFAQPVAELAEMIKSARARGEEFVLLGPPGGPELVALINSNLAEFDRDRFPWSDDFPPTQSIERIYWTVNLSSIARVLDVVRTTLIELVAEMRAGTPGEEAVPTRAVAEQAVDIAIYGKKNRVVVTQAGPASEIASAAGGAASAGADKSESRPRRLMWWIVGVATVVAAVAGVWLLLEGGSGGPPTP